VSLIYCRINVNVIKLDNEEHICTNDKEPEASLLIRYLQGLSSDAERLYIAKWLEESTDNEKILRQTAQIYFAQRAKQRIQGRNTQAAFSKIQHRLRKKARNISLRRFWIMAGCIVLLVSVALNVYYGKPKDAEIQYVTMQTNAGMRTDFTLPDGTEVFLNSDTKLIYPTVFDTKERRVELDGEGFFKVVPNKEQSFIVDIADKPLTIEVLGTAFNVQAYRSDNILRATLIEGAVRLGVENEAGTKKYVTLQPSQRATYDICAQKLDITRVNTMYDTAWMQGKLMFRETPLDEVLNSLSHFYNVSFQVKDSSIYKYTFTGTFDNRMLSQVLDYLSISSSIKYKIQEPKEDDSKEKKQTLVILTK